MSRLVSLCLLLLTLVPLITSIPVPPSTPRTITYDANGYKIDGRYRLFRGGSLQWFRIPPNEWRSRMQMLKDAGCNIIDMYVAWNQHERVQNVFDFTTHNITAFLDLAIEMDMFIYIRPGPYITNEMDGGGVPNWVFLNSTKRTIAADGRPNLRTEDPEWLDLSRHWLSAFNAVIAPYQYPRGGPILFYAIENEYNWFRQFFLADKAFWYDGQEERGLTQEMNPKKYLTALRDIVKSTGIEIPLTSCPGDGYVTDMGDVPDVLPMPNFYTDGTEEHGAYRVVSDMHNPTKFNGVYVNMPSGTSETWRDPIKMKRMLMGGFDLFMCFNLAGLHNEGYTNSLTMDIAIDKMFEFSAATWMTAFVSPSVSYYHTMVDNYGIISPSGALRAHYSDFHRTNMLLNDFESLFASGGLPWRSIDSNAPVKYVINNNQIGAKQDNKQVHYYRSMSTITSPNCYWLEIVNEQKTPTVITTGQITFGDLTFPQYVPLTVTTYNDPSRSFPLPYAMFIPIRQSIYTDSTTLTLTYTTSEMLTLRDFNGERLLVLYGPEGTQGELSLSSTSSFDIILTQVTTVRNDVMRKDFTYTYKSTFQTLTLRTSRGVVRIIITSLSHAGRIWFIQERDVAMMIAGLEQVTNIRYDVDGNVIFDYLAPFGATTATRFTVTSPKDVVIAGHTRTTYDVTTLTYTFSIPSLQTPIPTIPPTLLSTGVIAYDMAETQRTYDDSDWISWEGDAKPIEALGVNDGHFWYRVAFTLTAIPKASGFCNIFSIFCNNDHALNGLFVEHASDIIGIYINGKYITTLLPFGTSIDAASINQRYTFESFQPYLIIGRNVVSFRVESWGHGSFMFPRGNLLNSPGKFLPAAGFDSWRGLWGPVKMGPLKLTSFTFRAQLGGERNKAFTAPNAVLDMTKWKSATLPLQLTAGDIVWYRVSVPASMLPDGTSYRSPLVLEIKGRQAKATIYFNGVLVGRWLSDESWMSRGTWAHGVRTLTSNLGNLLDYDTFPMDRIERQPGGQNVFAICFEDVSVADPKGYNHDGYGRIEFVRLKYNQEIAVGTAGTNDQKRADNIRAQGVAQITSSEPASRNAANSPADLDNPDTLPASTSNDSSTGTSLSLWIILLPVIVGSIILLIIATLIIRRHRSSKHVTTMTRVTRAQSDPIDTEMTANPVASMAMHMDAADTLHTPQQVYI